MEIITINVTNTNNILSAKSRNGHLEIILTTGRMLYNNEILPLKNFIGDQTDEDINLDLLYLSVVLRKVIFENMTLRSNYNGILTALRKITVSFPFPENIKINLIIY